MGDQTFLQPPSHKNWLAAQAGILLLWSPWLPGFVIQSTRVYREFWIPGPTVGTVISAVGSLLSAHLPRACPGLATVWILFASGLLWGIIRLRRRPALLALLLALFLTPFVGEWLVSLRRPIFSERTLIWASIPLYLLLAAGIVALHHRRPLQTTHLQTVHFPVPLALAVLAGTNGLSLREYYVNFQKEAWREAAAYVAENVQGGDLILFNATWVQIPFDYYYGRTGRQVAEHGVPVDLFDRGILEPKMTADDLPRLHALLQGRSRVWLVYSHNWYTDPDGLIPAALDEALATPKRRTFYGLEVRLYESRMTPDAAR